MKIGGTKCDFVALIIIPVVCLATIGLVIYSYVKSMPAYEDWKDSCRARGGTVVTQYRSDDLCFIDGRFDSSYDY